MSTYRKVPKYRIIEKDLLDRIHTGSLWPDAPLPTEAELAEQYGVSRVTVRQALSELAYKGYIYKNRGSGSYVKRAESMQKTPEIKSFTEDIIEQGKKPSSVVHTFNVSLAGETMASILKIKATDRVYYIERTRFADEIPVVFERTFMSVDLHPEMSMKVLYGSKYQYAKEHGFEIEFAKQNIAPIFPMEYIANELKVSPTQPILRVKNPTYLRDGRVFDYTELYMNTDEYQLIIIKHHSYDE